MLGQLEEDLNRSTVRSAMTSTHLLCFSEADTEALCARISVCAEPLEFQLFAEQFNTCSTQLHSMISKLANFVAIESSINHAAVRAVVAFVNNAEAESAVQRVLSHLGKCAGLLPKVSFQHLVAMLISRSFDDDLRKFNHNLTSDAVEAVFSVIASTVLRSIRLAHASHCLSSSRALMDKLFDIRFEALAASIPLQIMKSLARNGGSFLFMSCSAHELRVEFLRDVVSHALTKCDGSLVAARDYLLQLLQGLADCMLSAQSVSEYFPITDWATAALTSEASAVLCLCAAHMTGYSFSDARDMCLTLDLADMVGLVRSRVVVEYVWL